MILFFQVIKRRSKRFVLNFFFSASRGVCSRLHAAFNQVVFTCARACKAEIKLYTDVVSPFRERAHARGNRQIRAKERF